MDRILAGNLELATAVARLERSAMKANALLERLAEAKRAERKAQRKAAHARKALRTFDGRLSKGRDDLRGWAVAVYTEGEYSENLALLDALKAEGDSPASPMGDIAYLTDEKIDAVALLREERDEQRRLTDEATTATRRATTERKKAEKARTSLSAVLKERRRELRDIKDRHRDELEKAGPVASSLIGLVDPDAQDARDALMAAMREANVDVAAFDAGKPCSDDETEYPNGQVPPSALCPLIGGNGEAARPGAAAAFNAMSKAYAKETGHLLCVTDGYRSYAEQVLVKAQRGGWAATPGRSNHGFGVAVDLCGGVEDFGHPAHLWMKQNAALYGWYHPAWAEPNGALPEPWHWEYAG
ncbi:D-alanyl-D-alanine carboxypeptidase family protein [Janibacter massiliensis]|uniref:D-alanyl-D-alanine carboxypeptidase family protein n=1 Tax=Janibacter massiliensis TaxID=2058291 RepID=UPI000D101766|nr:M15 family metallopeptidase [Janibacter massiliensis]